VVSDTVIATLNHLAQDTPADLVILSAHGHSAAREYPYGSVSASFITYGFTPLLIIQDLSPQDIAPNPAEAIVYQHNVGGRMLAYDKSII
jgi:hypothetical protein